jgi:hypothetical protein
MTKASVSAPVIGLLSPPPSLSKSGLARIKKAAAQIMAEGRPLVSRTGASAAYAIEWCQKNNVAFTLTWHPGGCCVAPLKLEED